MNDETPVVNRSISMTEAEWAMIERYGQERGMSRSMAVRYLCLYSPHGLVTAASTAGSTDVTKEQEKAA